MPRLRPCSNTSDVGASLTNRPPGVFGTPARQRYYLEKHLRIPGSMERAGTPSAPRPSGKRTVPDPGRERSAEEIPEPGSGFLGCEPQLQVQLLKAARGYYSTGLMAHSNQRTGEGSNGIGSEKSAREKSQLGESTFALSADITEAHRQVPSIRTTGISWAARSTGAPMSSFTHWDFWNIFSVVLLVGRTRTVLCERPLHHLAYACC